LAGTGREKEQLTMKVAILSDIHGNLEALTAVHRDLRGRADTVVCLGDNIGYGPDPEAVVRHLIENHYLSVMGNHEYALFDIRARRWLNFLAAENNEATAALLSDDSRAYCQALPFFLVLGRGYFVHGFPPDSVFRYLHRQPDARIAELFAAKPDRVYFLGHTHKLLQVTGRGGLISREVPAFGVNSLAPEWSYLFNCGSVGQPRDGDNRAKYMIWDDEGRTVEVRRVDYDRQKTMTRIRQRGFPEGYALRLR
jgi:predicted phosphodiesterase